MAVISLAEAVHHSKGLPHQIEAWEWLQRQLSEAQLAGFAERFGRQEPAAVAEAPGALISAAQAGQVFERPLTADQLADLNACLQRFAINTPARICHFLAQIAHESGGLRWLEELADGWAYEGRRDLGNREAGDGPRFKGAGAIQLTGRDNYQRFSDFIGDPQVMQGCAYVARHYPFTSAGFWWQSNRINAEVDAGASCRRISRLVNGRDPANGLADRQACFARAAAVIGVTTAGHAGAAAGSKRLAVPYFSQRDSGSDQARRMCFSSSCAMLAATLRPDLLGGGDDAYLSVVRRFGDTTEATAQLQALESLGIRARLDRQADFTSLEAQIDRGIPVPCGFLHQGPVDAPRGNGHWLCVVGYTPQAVIVHDPNGDLDLAAGVYCGADGCALTYSRRNFGRRWMVDEGNANAFAPGRGWAIIAEPPRA